MNKIVVYFLVVYLLLMPMSLTGCGKNKDDNHAMKEHTTEKAGAFDTYQIQTIKDSTSYPGSNIEYPQLININNDYATVNQSLADAVSTQIKNITVNNSVNTTVNLTYTITYDKNDLLCVLFEGVISVKEAAHPTNFAFSVCASTVTGELINPVTLINMNPGFLTKFKGQLQSQRDNNNRFDPEQWESIASYIHSFSDADLNQAICSNATVALEEGSVLILFPVSRAVGDYVKISVPLDWRIP